MSKFKHPAMNQVYRLYLSDKRPTNNDGLQSAYQSGLAGHPARFDMTSLAYAAWSAGRDQHASLLLESRREFTAKETTDD